MADVKWIKIVTDIFENRKIKQIEAMPDADSIIVIWFKLLCLAGNVNDGGFITITKDIPYTDEMLAAEFGRPLATIRLALSIFERFGMIEIVDNILCVSNWEKYQNIEGLERIREQTRIRNIAYRERKKLAPPSRHGMGVTSRVTHRDATDKEEEREREIDREIEKEIDKERDGIVPDGTVKKKFVPPSVEEVQAFVAEKRLAVDAEKFWNYYESNGWRVGKNPMKKWQAACYTWNAKENPKKPARAPDPELEKMDLLYEGET